jgi:hypothetical protein
VSSTTTVSLVIGVLVLAFLLYRQLIVRRLRETYRVVVIFAILGVVQLSQYLSASGTHIGGKVAVALVGSAVLAAVMGVLRALTVRIWRGEENQLFRQGTWVTAILWIIAVAAHLGLDALVARGSGSGSGSGGNIGDATLTLYLAVSLGVQQVVLLRRAERLDAEGRLADPPREPVS